LDGFAPQRDERRSNVIVLKQCNACGAYTTEPNGACCRNRRLLKAAEPILLPESPMPAALDFDDPDMWGHMLGGEA